MTTLITKKAEKELDKLPDAIARNIVRHLKKLEENPFPTNHKKLVGEDNYRLRIGAYRILYTVDVSRGTVTILRVAHRKTVYR